MADEARKAVVNWMRRDTPICPDHGVMKAYRTVGRVTYYRCHSCELRSKGTIKIVGRLPDIGNSPS